MSIPSFPTIDNRNIRAALLEAAAAEPGTVLNDHYSPDFYTDRRARFLGRHPNYAHVRNGLFEIAAFDADAVYGDWGDDLSVQEVRRREIANEIVPLLPLPTTGNTDSLNGFAGLPESEWEEGKLGVYRVLTPTPSRLLAPARLAGANDWNDGQRSQQAESGDVSLVPKAKRDSGVSLPTELADLQSADTTQQPTVVNGIELVPDILARLDQLYPGDSNGADVESLDTAATAPATNAPKIIPNGTSASATVARGTKRTATGRIVRPAPAYQNAAKRQPIKYKRNKERPLTGPNETVQSVSTDSEGGNDSAASDDETGAPPRKKLNIIVGTKPAKPARPAQPKKNATKGIEATSSATAKNAASRDPAAPKKRQGKTTPSDIINAIASGAALPDNPAQAKEAGDRRWDILLSHYRASFRARKKKAPEDEPDIMPEYFQVANFPTGQERDQVRCVCGVVVDDNRKMVCCDEPWCSVWQHVSCVGDAAPEDLEEGEYRCHNCDPWAHRRVIQGLRRANPVREGRGGG